MTRYVMCPDCDGAGRLDDDGDPSTNEHDDPCETCHGRGEILEGDE
jgi:DnaJ-class molecular chaperone